MARIPDSKLIKAPIIHDTRGNLSYIESKEHIPFEIKRIFYIYDIPGGAIRTGHAHRDLHQVIFALSGSFDVVLDDGFENERIQLNRAYNGLYLPNMIWRELDNFSSGAICMVLASQNYDATDYIRSYDEYVNIVNPPSNSIVL